MKFIFPQNYRFKNKLFGIIDYPTIILNVIWDLLILIIINLIFSDLTVKVFLFVFLCFPLLLFSFSGFNGENKLYFALYMIKLKRKQKRYLYSKTCTKNYKTKC